MDFAEMQSGALLCLCSITENNLPSDDLRTAVELKVTFERTFGFHSANIDQYATPMFHLKRLSE